MDNYISPAQTLLWFPSETYSSSTAAMIQNINTLSQAVFYAPAAEVLFLARKVRLHNLIPLANVY